MNYTVLWKPAAQQELAQLWINAADRNALAAAADLIDALLHTDPQSLGESRHNDMRILICPPLAVNFKVSEPDRTVLVSDIWLSGRHP
jgi:hypothetical protein